MQLKTGSDAYIHIVIEHKSAPDPLTPLQLLRYMTNIWTKLTQDEPGRPLAPILPLVFYHGLRRWNVPRIFQDLFADLPEVLERYTLQFQYALVDLGEIEDEKLSRQLRLRAYLKALKYNPRPDLLARGLDLIFKEFGAELPELDIRIILTYIFYQHPEIDRENIEPLLIRYAPERKEDIMSGFIQEIGEDYYKRGQAEGKAEILLHQLSRRFGNLPNNIEQRINQADSASLDRWALRILDASSLEDVFGH